MKTSILMSFYNAEPFFAPCLESILAQSDPEWELIAINNFATDDSVKTIKRFADRDTRITVLNNTREGIIPALQMALAKSSGQFITRMDADDIMPPEKLALMKEALISSGPGHIVTGQVRYFTHEGEVGGGFLRYAKWLNELTFKSENFTEIYKECVIPSPSWMCHRQDLISAGAFEPEVYPEDYDLCFRFYQQGLKVIGLPHLLHHWRDYPNRTSRTDKRYANQLFFDLKFPWFLKIDYEPSRPLVLWGSGPKGKQLARLIVKTGIPFHWITGNSAKHGKDIYGCVIQPESFLNTLDNPQILIAITAPAAIADVERRLERESLQKNVDFFLFC